VAAVDQPVWTYSSSSGGTQANLIGTLITSDPTGASNLGGTAFDASQSGGVARVSVPGLIQVGAITTSQTASPYGADGLQVTSKAKIAGVNLLNGAINVDAVETTNTARATPSGFSKEADSKLVNLTLGGKSYPVSAAPNTTVTIGNLAKVVINEQNSNVGSSGIESRVKALRVTLLEDFGGAKVGSTIQLAFSSVRFFNGGPSAAVPVGGFCFGLAAKVKASDASANVGPQPLLVIPSVGTGGKVITNSTANVDVPTGLLKAGAAECSVSGLSNVGESDAFAQAQIVRLNVLGGLITADAIKVKSHVVKSQTGHSEEQSLEFVNLKIGGKAIPASVKPNTRINIAGLGQVTINYQASQPGYSVIVGVWVVLSVQKLGLPIGASIPIGVANTFTAASN
jgi:hypothetical protein